MGERWNRYFRHDSWAIGIVESPLTAFLQPEFTPAIRWLPTRRDCYYADPFAVPCGEGDDILCERYDYQLGLGRLFRLTRESNGWQARELSGFPAGLHHSYPHIFEDGGDWWCVPECWQSGEIALYRRLSSWTDWRRETVLVPRFAGVDSTLFRHGECWWMATANENALPNEQLWLFHAPQLAGPWSAHARNPVKRDANGSRPAGAVFAHQGQLYRPAQDCSAIYGGAVVLNRITKLDPETFAEEAARRIEPDTASAWQSGLHTLSAAGSRTLVDGKRIRFIWQEFNRALEASMFTPRPGFWVP